MEENQKSEQSQSTEHKQGWSWMGCLFAPYYYAGYGKLKKGIIYALLSTFPPFGMVIAFLGGKNANKDLPVGQEKFMWGQALIAVTVTVATAAIMNSVFNQSIEVKTIKQSSLSMCPNATIEQMVNGFMENPSWDSGVGANGKKFVNISGGITYMNKPVNGVLQFVFSNDNTSFQYSAFEINEIPQNTFIGNELLTKMCKSAK